MKTLLKDPAKFYQPKKRPSGHDISTRFGAVNGGAIPSNLLQIPNTDSNSHYIRLCKHLGRAPTPARFPADLPRFFIRFIPGPRDLAVDIFSGSNMIGFVGEQLGRRWASIELDRSNAGLWAVRFMEGMKATVVRDAVERIEEGKPFQHGCGEVSRPRHR